MTQIEYNDTGLIVHITEVLRSEVADLVIALGWRGASIGRDEIDDTTRVWVTFKVASLVRAHLKIAEATAAILPFVDDLLILKVGKLGELQPTTNDDL